MALKHVLSLLLLTGPSVALADEYRTDMPPVRPERAAPARSVEMQQPEADDGTTTVSLRFHRICTRSSHDRAVYMPWDPSKETPLKVVIGPDPAFERPVQTASLVAQARDPFQQAIAAPEAITIDMPRETRGNRPYYPTLAQRHMELPVDATRLAALQEKYRRISITLVDGKGHVVGSSSILPQRLRYDEDKVAPRVRQNGRGIRGGARSHQFPVTVGFMTGLHASTREARNGFYRSVFDQYCDQTMTPLAVNFGSQMPTFSTEGVARVRAGSAETAWLAWPAQPSPLAWIALDRNQNGRIDDASELFGSATPFGEDSVATNGFVALSAFDLDGDDVLDAQEADGGALLLWFDDNVDGRSSPDELRPLSQYLSRVSLVAESHDWEDGKGNSAPLKAKAVTVAGEELNVYDFYLSRQESWQISARDGEFGPASTAGVR